MPLHVRLLRRRLEYSYLYCIKEQTAASLDKLPFQGKHKIVDIGAGRSGIDQIATGL